MTQFGTTSIALALALPLILPNININDTCVLLVDLN